jgi:hypothetical protein
MNYLAQFDSSMMVGHLKTANSTDLDVLHSRHHSLISSMELTRTLLFIPMAFGAIQVVVGIPALILLVGIVPITIGSFFIGASWWCRKRLADNIVIAQESYARYIESLPSSVSHVALPAVDAVVS